MTIKKIYAVDNVASVELAELTLKYPDEGQVNLLDFVPAGFKGKVVFHIEQVESRKDSLISLKSKYEVVFQTTFHDDVVFKIKTTNRKINNYYDESYITDYSVNDNLYIMSAVDIPYIAEKWYPADKKDYVERAKILNVFIVFASNNVDDTVVNHHRQVFDAYGRLGFVIVDISKFDEYVSAKSKTADLIHEFTTTELANDLFDQGLMLLSWGHTPWVYYLNSEKYERVSCLLGDDINFSGVYKFLNVAERYSVIPGNELADWNACKNKQWPMIEINGEGEYVSIRLFIKKAFSQTDNDYPIPTFHLQRTVNIDGDPKPLLETNIIDY